MTGRHRGIETGETADLTPDVHAPHAEPAADVGAERFTAPRMALLWSYALTIGRFATTAVVTVVMASYLGPEQYGVMALAMVWVVFAQSLAMHGSAQALIQQAEVTKEHLNAAFWTTLGGSALMAIVFAAAAPLWASANGNRALVHVCWALAPAILINAVVVVPDAMMRRQLAFKNLSLRVLTAGILSGVFGVAAAIAGWGVWALVIQQLTLTTFSAIFVWLAVKLRPGFTPIRPALKDMRSYSLHTASGFLANFIANRTDALLLGTIFGPVAIGLYRFAIRITDTVNDVAVGGLGQISLPHLARLNSTREAFARQAARVIHICALLALPAFGILCASASWLLTWIGPQWVDGIPAFRMLCVGGALGAVGTTLAVTLQAAGRPGIVAATGWGFAIATVAAMWLVGARYHHSPATTQVLAMAATYCSIHALVFAVGAVILCRNVLRVPLVLVFRPAVPATLAAILAVLAGMSIQRLLTGFAPFAGLVMTSLVASAAAGIVLLVGDRTVSTAVRRSAARLRRVEPDTA